MDISKNGFITRIDASNVIFKDNTDTANPTSKKISYVVSDFIWSIFNPLTMWKAEIYFPKTINETIYGLYLAGRIPGTGITDYIPDDFEINGIPADDLWDGGFAQDLDSDADDLIEMNNSDTVIVNLKNIDSFYLDDALDFSLTDESIAENATELYNKGVNDAKKLIRNPNFTNNMISVKRA